MSATACMACNGTGAKDGAACAGCQGSGLSGVNLALYPGQIPAPELPPKDGSSEVLAEVPAPPLKHAAPYWPQRWIQTVNADTLENWRLELDQKKAVLRAEMGKLDGGLAQIEEEHARRAQAKRARMSDGSGPVANQRN